MRYVTGRYTTGNQPCGAFDERDEVMTGMGNVHECFGPYPHPRPEGVDVCGARVSNCAACGFDHHEGANGWDDCGKLPLDNRD